MTIIRILLIKKLKFKKLKEMIEILMIMLEVNVSMKIIPGCVTTAEFSQNSISILDIE
jgi:hypothetical protein